MKSKEEMIQIMRNAHQDCLCNADGTVDEAWEAALKALRGALPELTKKTKFSGFIDVLVVTDAPKLYKQLKQ